MEQFIQQHLQKYNVLLVQTLESKYPNWKQQIQDIDCYFIGMNYTQNGIEIVKNMIQSEIYAFISDKVYNESDQQIYQDVYLELKRINVEPILIEQKPIIIEQKPKQQLPPPGDTANDNYQMQDIKFLNVSGKLETKKKEVIQTQQKPRQQKKQGTIDMFLKKKQQ